MSAPKLFYGLQDSARVVRAGVGRTDAGAPVRVLCQTDAIAPGGAGRDCIFHAAYITFTYTMPATVRVTPILDDVELTGEALEFNLPASGTEQSTVFEVGLSAGYVRGGRERFRTGQRGTWFALKVEVPETLDGRLIAEVFEVEYDVLAESKEPAKVGMGAG